ncbi:dCTP deaminase [Candidatus Peregrinibacteria bacterium]|nr:dCTP deaminase [Candidatus Peregrinibacteria bacterium]
MILSDKDIKDLMEKGEIVVESPDGKHVEHTKCASMDFRLGNVFKVYDHSKHAVLDPTRPETLVGATKTIAVEEADTPFIVQPGEFILGVTMEKIKVPDFLVARCEGRSSIGRLGIIIHSTAGFVDPGFEGNITLEITNINRMPVALYPGMRIGQFAFEKMTSVAETPYYKKSTSKYSNQILPEESRIALDPEFELIRKANAIKEEIVIKETKNV